MYDQGQRWSITLPLSTPYPCRNNWFCGSINPKSRISLPVSRLGFQIEFYSLLEYFTLQLGKEYFLSFPLFAPLNIFLRKFSPRAWLKHTSYCTWNESSNSIYIHISLTQFELFIFTFPVLSRYVYDFIYFQMKVIMMCSKSVSVKNFRVFFSQIPLATC